ncbi:MAG: FKBP-type peptidyl-prolyl cis-trans isomerase [Candidatus Aenigmarchaeota archaeon]|nr:FKBP-type peptidyl-prolyl cis-trans isomerase [Candidatus Aenigmarchaeota archaeon]
MKKNIFMLILVLLVSGCVSNGPHEVGVCDDSLKVQNNDLVEVQYVGTFTDGTEFDSGTLSFNSMSMEMIGGFDSAVSGLCVGDEVDVDIQPEDAYPYRDDLLIIVPVTQTYTLYSDVAITDFSERFGEEPAAGKIYLDENMVYPLKVTEVSGDNVTIARDVSEGSTYDESLWDVRVISVNATHFTVRRLAEDGISVTTPYGPKTAAVTDNEIRIDMNSDVAGKVLHFYIKVLNVTKAAE